MFKKGFFTTTLLLICSLAVSATGPIKNIKSATTFTSRVDELLSHLTPDQTSLLQLRLDEQRVANRNKVAITYFEPTFIMPFYYTGTPYQQPYNGLTPLNQKIMNEEFKAQLSLQFTVWNNILHTPINLNLAYTQLSYWQFYAKSQYFRETNYEPALFLSDNFTDNWLGMVGIVHQSNGRGGNLERSWNRVFFNLIASGDHWLINFNPWFLIFKKQSSDLHNPDIARYLGYGRLVFAFGFAKQTISVMFRNTIASGFKRGAIQIDYTFPIHGKLRGFVQFFSGYGQSMIEYNHYTNSAGIGLSLYDWV